MHRALTTAFAAFALALIAASGAAAAQKTAVVNAGCSGGIGQPVCCKAFVANHCGYVSCCEKGNAAFYSATHCGRCDEHASEKAAVACAAKPAASAAAGAAHGCATVSTSCEVGNRMFFSGAACTTAAKAAKGDCCGAKAAK
jgi:hypothetical protein